MYTHSVVSNTHAHDICQCAFFSDRANLVKSLCASACRGWCAVRSSSKQKCLQAVPHTCAHEGCEAGAIGWELVWRCRIRSRWLRTCKKSARNKAARWVGSEVRGDAMNMWRRRRARLRVSQFMGDESILHSNDYHIATTRSRAVFSTACVFTSSTVRAQCVHRAQPWQ